MRILRVIKVTALSLLILSSVFAHLNAIAGDAEVGRNRNLQLPQMGSGDADLLRYRNLQTLNSAPSNADVIRYRNLQLPLMESDNADTTRPRNLQIPLAKPNNADTTRFRNTQTPQIESNNADVIRTGNLGAFQLANEWDDDDLDGTPNYLDLPSFAVLSGHAQPTIFGGIWDAKIFFARPATTVVEMASDLCKWGINDVDHVDIALVIVELSSPYRDNNEFLDWIEQFLYFGSQARQEATEKLDEVRCSDGKYRFLALLTSEDSLNWNPTYYWLKDHSPLAGAVVLLLIVAAAPLIVHVLTMAVEFARGKYNLAEDVGKLCAAGILMAFVFTPPTAPVAIAFWVADLATELYGLGSAIADPFIDLAVYDSSNLLVLGYSNGTIVSNSSLGIYFGRTDQMQILWLSKQALPLNVTITNGNTKRRIYTGLAFDMLSNETLCFGSTVEPGETESAVVDTLQSHVKANHIVLQHDFARASLLKGETVPVRIQVTNQDAAAIENASVKAYVGNQTFAVSNLGSGMYSFLLDSSALGFGANSTVVISASYSGYFGSFNIRQFSVVFNVTLEEVKPFKEVICKGYSSTFNVTLDNQGDYEGSANLTLYANQSVIQTQSIDLTGRDSVTVGFSWDTKDCVMGRYVICAYAQPVQNENDTSDNVITYVNFVCVTIAGDVNADRKVDLKDVFAVGKAFGSIVGDPRYNPNLDINNDGKIDLKDYYTTCKNYGKSW